MHSTGFGVKVAQKIDLDEQSSLVEYDRTVAVFSYYEMIKQSV
jgi:hypothetical protein